MKNPFSDNAPQEVQQAALSLAVLVVALLILFVGIVFGPKYGMIGFLILMGGMLLGLLFGVFSYIFSK